MRDDLQNLDLRFPSVVFGAYETPWDLKVLLHIGGAKAKGRQVLGLIAGGSLGPVQHERLDLVRRIHEEINGKLIAGGSRATARNEILSLRHFFAWAEQSNISLTFDSIQESYLKWADYLVHRYRVVKSISERSAYIVAARVGAILDEVLERRTAIIQLTRLRMPRQRKTARGVQAEKQNLRDTFTFGHLLVDICDGLPLDVVLRSSLPIRIPLRSGGEIIQWSGAKPPGRWSSTAFAAYEADGTFRTRFPLANLRIEAELLMFIGQTGMNLAEAQHIKLRSFSYASHYDGYQVKERKNRRGGEVLFDIYKEYKPHFERYLEWRRKLFGEFILLFPFANQRGDVDDRSFQDKGHQFRLRTVCLDSGIKFVPPRELRNTRVNWLLRQSGDPDLTAEMAQHTKQVLGDVYERPSQQRAIGELMRYWSKNDPPLVRTSSVGPGECGGQPVPTENIPHGAAKPDCIRPSGCLWCEHHRDIDSQDYVWSLASYRYLKSIELSKWHVPRDIHEIHPAQYAIDQITEKFRWLRASNDIRASWVEEALVRIEESSYHADWEGIIIDMEGPNERGNQ